MKCVEIDIDILGILQHRNKECISLYKFVSLILIYEGIQYSEKQLYSMHDPPTCCTKGEIYLRFKRLLQIRLTLQFSSL